MAPTNLKKTSTLGSSKPHNDVKEQHEPVSNASTIGVHTEMVWETYPLLIDFVRNFRTVLFVLTPANYDYAKAFFGFRGSQKEFSNNLTEKYKELAKYAGIELHLHVGLFPEFLPLDEKRSMFKDALQWGEQHGFRFKRVAFGWWKYDSECLKLCNEMGIKVTERGAYPHIHDYDLLFFKRHEALSRALKTKSTTLFAMKFMMEQARWFLFFLKRKSLRRYLSTYSYTWGG